MLNPLQESNGGCAAPGKKDGLDLLFGGAYICKSGRLYPAPYRSYQLVAAVSGWDLNSFLELSIPDFIPYNVEGEDGGHARFKRSNRNIGFIHEQ
jgi:hypothetical protein